MRIGAHGTHDEKMGNDDTLATSNTAKNNGSVVVAVSPGSASSLAAVTATQR